MGPLVLLPDILLFLGVAAACFALGLWRAKGEDPNEAATSSTGTEMRRRLQLLLLLANVARAVGLVVETVLFEDGACPGAWTCALVRGGPDLLFLTTYSMLILFWAQVRVIACLRGCVRAVCVVLVVVRWWSIPNQSNPTSTL